MKVLITRPQPDAEVFAALGARSGIEAIIAPVMTIQLLTKKLNMNDAGALAFTSANGVRAFAKNSADRSLPVFAVGRATADAARAAGFSDIRIAGGDVEQLSGLILNERNSFAGDLLHIAGAQRAGDLISLLSSAGIKGRRETLYDARLVEALPKPAVAALSNQPPVDWAAFFSPRTAAHFIALVRKAGLEDRLRHVRALCLSQAVAKAARPSLWKEIVVAKGRHANAMISAIIAGQTG